MTDQELIHIQEGRIKILEEAVEILISKYETFVKANNVNGQQFFGIVDQCNELTVNFHVLLELLNQDEIVSEKEFEKYRTVISRMVKKKRLEELFNGEENE